MIRIRKLKHRRRDLGLHWELDDGLKLYTYTLDGLSEHIVTHHMGLRPTKRETRAVRRAIVDERHRLKLAPGWFTIPALEEKIVAHKLTGDGPYAERYE